MRALNTATVLARALSRHGCRYSYDKFVYVNKETRVTITCPIHGDFEQFPFNHTKGAGCEKCAREAQKGCTESFIQKARAVHGEHTYDYTETVYKSTKDQVTIRCPLHGAFNRTANSHLNGCGCNRCAWDTRGLAGRLSQEQFIQSASKRHGNLYDYSETFYTRTDLPITIICSKHGRFIQTAHTHLYQGCGCPKCAKNKFSIMAAKWLEYRAKQDSIHIEHAMNEGEHWIRHPSGKMFQFDGYDAANRHVFEFLGDFWHGNPAMYTPDDVNAKNKRKMGESV